MTREEAHKLVDELFDSTDTPPEKEYCSVCDKVVGQSGKVYIGGSICQGHEATVGQLEAPEKPKDKRVIRTKSTGDRVYVIDEVAKTKAWVTSPEILTKLGFELSEVEDVDDSSLLGYAMTASVYRVED